MAKTLELWFRRQYRLPPTDPRYLAMTPYGIAVDFWANHHADIFYSGKPDEEEFEDEDFDLDAILRENAEGDDQPDDFEEVP